MDHLLYSGQPDDVQHEALEAMIRDEPVLMAVLEGMTDAALPEGLLVAGAIYNTVWNRLTGHPPLHGVKDIDVFYFDDSDLTFEAEDRVIKAFEPRFSGLPVPVEIRNQARVHLWFPQKFGIEFTPLSNADEMLGRYASKTHAVGARLGANGTMQIVAPFGLNDIFSFRIVPNTALDNRWAHETKGARAHSVWPEVSVVPWPES